MTKPKKGCKNISKPKTTKNGGKAFSNKGRSKNGLRNIAEPFVVAPPAGASTTTRVRLTDQDRTFLIELGMFLGSLQRKDLTDRLHVGDSDGKYGCRAERKQALTALSSSRWAGTITQVNDTLYKTSLRNLDAAIATHKAAIASIEKRCAVKPGTCDVKTRVKGYKDKQEDFQKRRRLSVLKDRLAKELTARTEGKPSIVMGSKRLWVNRQHLQAAELTQSQWRDRWDYARLFLTANGATGELYGNQTIRVYPDGKVRIKVPGGLLDKYGCFYQLTYPVVFHHQNDILQDRIVTNKSIGYSFRFDIGAGKVFLKASWKLPELPSIPSVAALKHMRALCLDLNGNHIAGWVIDQYGNPVGQPITIELDLKGLPSSARDGHIRDAITKILDLTVLHNCGVIVVENLNFADARDIGRETMGHGRRGKRFRKTVAGIPTSKFKDRLSSMAYTVGLWVIAVDPAYTTRWGRQHWLQPLQAQQAARKHKKITVKGGMETSVETTLVSKDHASVVPIGRRAKGFGARRKKSSPATPGVTAAGSSPTPRRGVQMGSAVPSTQNPKVRVVPSGEVFKNLNNETFKRVLKRACVNGYTSNPPGPVLEPFTEPQQQQIDTGLPASITIVDIE